MQVNGVAFSGNCAYSCILGTFARHMGCYTPTRGGGGVLMGGRGQSSHIPDVHHDIDIDADADIDTDIDVDINIGIEHTDTVHT